MRKLISGVLAALVVLSFPALALADAAGTAKGVNPAADAALDGATRTLVVGADIFIGDQLTTGPKGQVQILFADNTKLVVGPHSSLRIDDFLVRNNGDAGKFVVDMLSGSFRFATGNGPKDKYELDTPTGTIGVRGTWFDVFVDLDGTTRILHYEGIVKFRAKHEKKWTELHDLCTIGQISAKASILGNSQTTTGKARDQLKREFIYADNQAPLKRAFWFIKAFDCLHRPTGVDAPPPVTPTTPTGPIIGRYLYFAQQQPG
ncbi:MAG: FecR family protein [Devosia sp.]